MREEVRGVTERRMRELNHSHSHQCECMCRIVRGREEDSVCMHTSAAHVPGVTHNPILARLRRIVAPPDHHHRVIGLLPTELARHVLRKIDRSVDTYVREREREGSRDEQERPEMCGSGVGDKTGQPTLQASYRVTSFPAFIPACL